MSMGNEWKADHAYDFYDIQSRIEDEAEHGVWTTKEGKEIPVEEMTTSHIRNVIAYIERTDEYDLYAPWLKVFKDELKRR